MDGASGSTESIPLKPLKRNWKALTQPEAKAGTSTPRCLVRVRGRGRGRGRGRVRGRGRGRS